MSTTTIILLLAVLLNALGNVLIKYGMNHVGAIDLAQPIKALMTIFLNIGVLAGISFYVLALAGYSYTLSRMNLSVAYPIMSSLGFVAVLLISATFLQEKIQPMQFVGCGVILLGVWLTSSSAIPVAQTKQASTQFPST